MFTVEFPYAIGDIVSFENLQDHPMLIDTKDEHIDESFTNVEKLIGTIEGYTVYSDKEPFDIFAIVNGYHIQWGGTIPVSKLHKLTKEELAALEAEMK